MLARWNLAELPHRARHVAGIGANQEPIVTEPGQADPTQPAPGLVDGDHFAGVYLPPVGMPDDSAAAHRMDPLPVGFRCCTDAVLSEDADSSPNRLAFGMHRQGEKAG